MIDKTRTPQFLRIFDNFQEVSESMRSSEVKRNPVYEEKAIVDPLLEQAETIFNLEIFFSFSMADLIQVPVK